MEGQGRMNRRGFMGMLTGALGASTAVAQVARLKSRRIQKVLALPFYHCPECHYVLMTNWVKQTRTPREDCTKVRLTHPESSRCSLSGREFVVEAGIEVLL